MKDKDFTNIAANRFFGFVLEASSDNSAQVSMPLRAEYLQEGGVVHGGVIAALADTTAVYALFPQLPEHHTMTSVEFKVNFVAPATLADGDLLAIARLVKRGRRVGLCDVEVFQKEKLIAKGLFTYLFFKR